MSEGSREHPLAFANQGQTVSVASVRAGKADVQHHLENLGFVEGSRIRIISEQQGNLIVEVKGARVALNRATASRITVR
ncbi:ferrous iron transport protein A [Berryella wangjianweii]|uniref:Ferrous iron transport protein A n=1 Tax=Berryella wangjianweii TaxID=2734634 RepID=A0A6M8J1F6_9ACTN|nr:FeoA family protein [Berryella wangjianweii]NPD32066.1 ferrous iron transport protein A [Eggerthellaceae bacterium zg-997]QKF07354.1 ferrous iron transport protein A [Berryella wangjianweii]